MALLNSFYFFLSLFFCSFTLRMQRKKRVRDLQKKIPGLLTSLVLGLFDPGTFSVPMSCPVPSCSVLYLPGTSRDGTVLLESLYWTKVYFSLNAQAEIQIINGLYLLAFRDVIEHKSKAKASIIKSNENNPSIVITISETFVPH